MARKWCENYWLARLKSIGILEAPTDERLRISREFAAELDKDIFFNKRLLAKEWGFFAILMITISRFSPESDLESLMWMSSLVFEIFPKDTRTQLLEVMRCS